MELKEYIDECFECIKHPENVTWKHYNLLIKLIYNILNKNKDLYEKISNMNVEDKDNWLDAYKQKNHDINIIFVEFLKQYGFDYDKIEDENRLEVNTKLTKIYDDIYNHFGLGELMLKYLLEQ